MQRTKSLKDPMLKHRKDSLDLFTFEPIVSNFPSVSSSFGVICSCVSIATLIFYIIVASKEFVTQQPLLVQVGSTQVPLRNGKYGLKIPSVAIEMSYWKKDKLSGNLTHVKLDSSNEDPYFRYEFYAKQIKEQDMLPRNQIKYQGRECKFHESIQRNVICPHESLHSNQHLQGTFHHELFQYFEIELKKCDGDLIEGCASLEDIDESIHRGDVSIVLHVLDEDFDPVQYHTFKNLTNAISTNLNSWRFFAEPNREQMTEVFMEGRKLISEHHLWGSFRRTNIDITSYHTKETTYRYKTGIELVNFYFRLHNQIRQEEIWYQRNSILWGAITAFLIIFCFGKLANLYNQYKFKSFIKEMEESVPRDNQLTTTQTIERRFLADPRFIVQEDFDEHGSLKLSIEDLYFPTKPIGELRRMALLEHVRRHQAATKLCIWYKTYRHENLKQSSERTKENVLNHHHIFDNQKQASSPGDKDDSEINSPELEIASPQSFTSSPSVAIKSTGEDSELSSPLVALIATGENSELSSPSVAMSATGEYRASVSETLSLKEKDAASISSSTIGALSQATPRDTNSIKKALIDNSIQLIKKAAHNVNLKPWTEVSDSIPQVAALTLFQDFFPTSNSSRSITWEIEGAKITEWIGLRNDIHPVNFEGKVVTLPGQKPSVYAWAKIETCEVKYDKKSRILTLRIQTSLSGTGIPDDKGNPQFKY